MCFSQRTNFTQTLTSCTRAVYARERCARKKCLFLTRAFPWKPEQQTIRKAGKFSRDCFRRVRSHKADLATERELDNGARKSNNWLEWQTGHRKSSLVLSARFPVVKWLSRSVAKSAYKSLSTGYWDLEQHVYLLVCVYAGWLFNWE